MDSRAGASSAEQIDSHTYEIYAKEYVAHADESTYNALYERPALQQLVGPVQGKRVLDAGCAGGAHGEWLLRNGASVVALDASPAMVEIARGRLGANTTVIRADLSESLPAVVELADGGFDLVISSLTMHYIGNWSVPLGEFRRLLKADGRLVMSVHHPSWDRDLLNPADYFEVGAVSDKWYFGVQQVDVTFYRRTLSDIVNSLGDAGFHIEQLVEPAPTDELRSLSASDFAALRAQPAFLMIRASKL